MVYRLLDRFLGFAKWVDKWVDIGDGIKSLNSSNPFGSKQVGVDHVLLKMGTSEILISFFLRHDLSFGVIQLASENIIFFVDIS